MELHQGTFTSQSFCKKMNRKIEYVLRDLEFLSTWDYLINNTVYPLDIIKDITKKFLLCQFHDVLPGSCINDVYKDVKEIYDVVNDSSNKLVHEKIESILRKNITNLDCVLYNSNITNVNLVYEFENEIKYDGEILQKSYNNKILLPIKISQLSLNSLKNSVIKVDSKDYLLFKEEKDLIIIENKYLIVKLSLKGEFKSIIDKEDDMREIIEDDSINIHHLMIYNDIPFYWDAWDIMPYYKESGKICEIDSMKILEKGPLRSCIQLNYSKIGEKSSLIQKIYMYYNSRLINIENDIDWNESHKLLKAEFTTPIHSFSTRYDIPYGYIDRPTHSNTSWDRAKYEVCGHNYMSINERGYSISILNDCKYGMGTRDNTLHLV